MKINRHSVVRKFQNEEFEKKNFVDREVTSIFQTSLRIFDSMTLKLTSRRNSTTYHTTSDNFGHENAKTPIHRDLLEKFRSMDSVGMNENVADDRRG